MALHGHPPPRAVTATVTSLEAHRRGVVSLKGYAPRWYQLQLHENATRFNVWVCHRRFGKTVACVNELLHELCLLMAAGRERPRAAYVAPFYRQAKRVAWDYVRKYTAPFGRRRKVLEGELSVLLPCQARLSLYGADNPDSLRGEYFDIVVIDEVAQVSPRVWSEILRPALADREGRAIFIGTPRGRMNLFYRLWEHAADAEGWSRAMFTVDDTDAISDAELHALRGEMSEDEYRQELLCDWNAATPGAYYGRYLDEAEREGRIRDVGYDRSLPVLTSWDFGLRDPTVVVYWQVHGAEIRCLGCDAIADLSLPEIVAQVRASRPWSFAAHYIPPADGMRRDGDQVGAPRRDEIMAEHGFSPTVARRLSREDGIEAVKRGLHRVVWDAKGCQMLLEAMRLYRSEYDDVRGIYKPIPVHDWTSHYADAVRTFFAATDGRTGDLWGQREFDLVDQELERSAI